MRNLIRTKDMTEINDYARMLQCLGHDLLEEAGLTWFSYNGFLRPACMPHEVPAIEREQAAAALRRSSCPFVRWDSDFGTAVDSKWWYVLRRGPYAIEQLSGNTRSKIRRGGKRLQARPASVDEISGQGYQVCQAAVARYGNQAFLPSRESFNNKLRAASNFSEQFEFYGIFSNGQLVGFSENHIQGNAVFWESIWYHPDHLGNYSSYLLTHSMLDEYLNRRGMQYASDGSRSLYHETNVQSFLVGKFAFERCPARLNLVYSPALALAMGALRPFRWSIQLAAGHWRVGFLKKLGGLLTQDAIAHEIAAGTYRKHRGG
ncbi:MAG: GNAT family N-acetyltransferase [Verrucomicrobia bacterium]|jgi:hypothetical protein|nr:GNAT family N-acetyltransferase [Verrucomicrobiota bacterium]